MAAPKGNQFWKLRSRHGREKLFASPDLMWKAACEYFEWCDANPFNESQAFAYQGDVQLKKVPKMRPYTLEGICLYFNANTEYWRAFRSENHNDFSSVIAEIENTIRNQKFSGAAAGFFNANIIARDLGLKEQTENLQTVVIPDISDEQRKKFREGFDNKY
jgi:hypothetical protein